MGLAVVMLGGDAAEPRTVEHVTATAWRMGFDIVVSRSVPARDVAAARDHAGGSGRPAWRDIGVPDPDRQTEVVVLHDVLPREPRTDRPAEPGVDNVRVARLQERLGRSVPRRSSTGTWSVSASVSARTAERATSFLFDEHVRREVTDRDMTSAGFRNPPDVIRPLTTLGERARVDVVEHRGVQAVRKTFRPGRQRYLDRELFVMGELAGAVPAVAELLDSGVDHLVMPAYRDLLAIDGERLNVAARLVPLPVAEEMVDVVRAFHDAGYSMVDAHPGHFLFDRDGRLRVVDFEFLHRYAVRPPLHGCYEFAGVPDGLDERDVPVPAWMYATTPYDFCWRAHLGYGLPTAVAGSSAARRAERVRHVGRRLTGRVARGVGRRLGMRA